MFVDDVYLKRTTLLAYGHIFHVVGIRLTRLSSQFIVSLCFIGDSKETSSSNQIFFYSFIKQI